MKCPYCGNDMEEGFIQSAREIFYTAKPHSVVFKPDYPGEISLSTHNWTKPTGIAHNCRSCRKIIIEYSEND